MVVCKEKLQFRPWVAERLFLFGDRGSGILDVSL